MTYFIVIPLFAAWLAVCLGVSLMLRIRSPEWRGRRYFFHASLWSSVGIVVANILLITGLDLGLQLMNNGGDSEGVFQTLSRLVWAVSAFLGPLVVSVAGWAVGIVVVLAIAHWKVQHATG